MNAGTSERLLASLRQEYGLSERHFERLFRASIGVRPQQYRRILRFQKAIRQLQSPYPPKLSTIAYELDYADQSHFIRAFRAFSGFTPTAFVRQDLNYTDFSQAGLGSLPVRLVRCP